MEQLGYVQGVCLKNVIPPEKRNKKVGKKHYRISSCLGKVNVLPLILTLIYNIKVSIELARCDSLKRSILSFTLC